MEISYENNNNYIEFILKSQEFFKKSDINELDITSNSDKLKDFSSRTNNEQDKFSNYIGFKNFYENKNYNNLNSVSFYNINEEEEIHEIDQDCVIGDIKLKYNNPVMAFSNNPIRYSKETISNLNGQRYEKNKINFTIEDQSEINENYSQQEKVIEEINEHKIEFIKTIFDEKKKIYLLPSKNGENKSKDFKTQINENLKK